MAKAKKAAPAARASSGATSVIVTFKPKDQRRDKGADKLEIIGDA